MTEDVPDGTSRDFALAAAGDRVALDRLLVRYLPQMHAFVRTRLGPELRGRESSLDVVQSVCRKLLGSRLSFAGCDESRFRAWLFTAALNKMRERHRRMHSDKRDVDREQSLATEGCDATLAHLLTPSQVAMGREVGSAIAAAMGDLSEEHREVITLARIVRLPHEVIAEVMGRSQTATRQLLARAMVQLTFALRRRGIDVDESRP